VTKVVNYSTLLPTYRFLLILHACYYNNYIEITFWKLSSYSEPVLRGRDFRRTFKRILRKTKFRQFHRRPQHKPSDKWLCIRMVVSIHAWNVSE